MRLCLVRARHVLESFCGGFVLLLWRYNKCLTLTLTFTSSPSVLTFIAARATKNALISSLLSGLLFVALEELFDT